LITTPGAVSDEILLPISVTVLQALIPQVSTLVESISLGEIESGRTGTFFVSLLNDGNAELQVAIDESSSGIVGSGEATIPAGETGRIGYRIDLEDDGLFTGILILNTNDPQAPQLTIPINAVGITIPPEPRTDFN
jgi:hypothetical protein